MSSHIREDVPIRCRLYSYRDSTYSLELFSPPSAWMIKKASGILKGSPAPGWEVFGDISLPALYEIAKIKLEMDSNLKHLTHE
mmetsp:Transcript_10339/g.1549  ORF Transcript_10339/g.1549 Transcript_10339/m.1549 type:complete len:83 (-) Transcript_10339:132-380(-)